MLGIKPSVSFMLGKHSTIEDILGPWLAFFVRKCGTFLNVSYDIKFPYSFLMSHRTVLDVHNFIPVT
jgi:hypothetical protein